MKKLILAVLIGGIAFGASAQTKKKKVNKSNSSTEAKITIAATDSVGNILFSKKVHDFGTIPQGIPVTFTFTFTNTNPNPITITNARASCGCTTPNYSKEPVASGATGTITVRYNAASLGYFNKNVTITTNLGTITLYIKGTVQAKPTEPEPTPLKVGG